MVIHRSFISHTHLSANVWGQVSFAVSVFHWKFDSILNSHNWTFCMFNEIMWFIKWQPFCSMINVLNHNNHHPHHEAWCRLYRIIAMKLLCTIPDLLLWPNMNWNYEFMYTWIHNSSSCWVICKVHWSNRDISLWNFVLVDTGKERQKNTRAKTYWNVYFSSDLWNNWGEFPSQWSECPPPLIQPPPPPPPPPPFPPP